MKKLSLLIVIALLFGITSTSFAASWETGPPYYKRADNNNVYKCTPKAWTVEQPNDPYQPVRVATGESCVIKRIGNGYGYGAYGYSPYGYSPYGYGSKTQRILRAGQVGLGAVDMIIDIFK